MSDSFVTAWTLACQAPLSMGFLRQGYWSGLPFSPLRELSDSGVQPTSPVSLALADKFFTTEPPGKPKGLIVKLNLNIPNLAQFEKKLLSTE